MATYGGPGGGGANDGDGWMRDSELLGPTINLLMDRIHQLERRQASSQGATRVFQRPLDLPSPRKETDGSITVISVYQWIKMLTRAVQQLHLPQEYVLYQLASSKLPSEWKEICAGSDNLDTALQRIRQRVPPLQASFPGLVAALTSKQPTSGLNSDVIERCGEHLSSISALQALFDQDISRENCLAALASIGQTHELSAMMVNTVRQFDWYKQLPRSHPDHHSYLDQLKHHLEEQRQTRQDVEASVQCGRVGDEDATATISSFAIGVQKPRERLPRRAKRAETPAMASEESVRGEPEAETSDSNSGEPEDEERGTSNGEPGEENSESNDGVPENEDREADKEGEGATDTEGEEEIDTGESEDENASPESEDESSGDDNGHNSNLKRTCVICHQTPSHAPFRCGLLEDIRRGRLLRPSCICPRCCNYRGRNKPHTEDCHIRRREDQNGAVRVQSFLCKRHGSGVHFLLCGFC